MVQYKPQYTRWDSPKFKTDHRWFWKLENFDREGFCCYDMTNRLLEWRFHFKTSANRKRLLHLLSRAERGLLSYDGCSVLELRKFCSDRMTGMPICAMKGKLKKQELVGILEREDEQATFPFFLELPAELRNRIYTIHFGEFEDTQILFPPPVTTVSRQLRDETLLLFYQSCRLIICIPSLYNWPYSAENCGMRTVRGTEMFARKDTARFFSEVPERYLANMRRLLIEGVVFTDERWFKSKWMVDFLAGGKKVRLQVGEPCCGRRGELIGFEEAQEKVERRMRAALEAIASRENGRGLCKTDLETFRRVLTPEDKA